MNIFAGFVYSTLLAYLRTLALLAYFRFLLAAFIIRSTTQHNTFHHNEMQSVGKSRTKHPILISSHLIPMLLINHLSRLHTTTTSPCLLLTHTTTPSPSTPPSASPLLPCLTPYLPLTLSFILQSTSSTQNHPATQLPSYLSLQQYPQLYHHQQNHHHTFRISIQKIPLPTHASSKTY